MMRLPHRLGRLALGVAALCLLAPFAEATTIDDLSLGETWYGEALKPADLKGRVVLVEFWGYN